MADSYSATTAALLHHSPRLDPCPPRYATRSPPDRFIARRWAPPSAHSGQNEEGGRLGRPCGPGAHSRASQKTRLRLRCRSRIQLPYHLQHCWRWSCPDAHRPPMAPRPQERPPTVRSDASCMASTTRVMPADQLRVLRSSRQQACAPTWPLSPDEGEDRAPGLGACWVATALAGRREHGHGERRAGQGRRRGLPLRLSAAWRARWHDGCAAPTGVFSILGRVQGRSARATISRPGRSRTSSRPRSEPGSGHCVDRRPTNNGGRHEHHRRDRQRDPPLPRRCAAGGAGRPSPTDREPRTGPRKRPSPISPKACRWP